MRLTTLCYIEKDGKYLMLHRTKKKNDENHDKWIGVGGKFEPGESPDECLIREVKEETGLYVRPESICELGEIIELHRDIFEPDKKFICHSLFFYCDVFLVGVLFYFFYLLHLLFHYT